jgi:hypothetical protein
VGFGMFAVTYEHYPRPGWADAAIYTSYATLGDAYSHIYGYFTALNGATYQFSRFGHIAPLRVLTKYFGSVDGRLAYNSFLFLVYSLSVLRVANVFLKDNLSLVLVCGFLLLNPQFVSAIVSGGADGPAGTYLLASIACLLSKTNERKALRFFCAGACLALSLSAHIFYVLPYGLALFALCFYWRRMVDRRRIKAYIVASLSFICGFTAVISVFNLYAKHLGLQAFYLSYSFGRVHTSLQGSGAKFEPPPTFWLQQASLWIGVVAFLFVALWSRRANTGDKGEERYNAAGVAVLCFSLPLIFVLCFDVLVGGGMIPSPHYFNAFIPCFAVGAVFQLSSSQGAELDMRTRSAFVIASLLSVASAASLPANYSLFASNGIGSKDMLISQQRLATAISQAVKGGSFNLVYPAARDSGGRSATYIDYFEGKKRIFDYIDSLAFLFPWVGDKTHRINLDNSGEAKLSLAEGLPTVFLARSRGQLLQILSVVDKSVGEVPTKGEECGGAGTYQWCILVKKNE